MLAIAVPVAASSYLRSGLNTAEQMLIPWGLKKYGLSENLALGEYGMIGGMVMPVIMLPAVLVANAFPIVCAVVYTVCIISALLGVSSLADPALFAALGMGLFSYIDTVIYSIFPLGYFGLYVDLIFIIFTFIVGFTIGKSKRVGA